MNQISKFINRILAIVMSIMGILIFLFPVIGLDVPRYLGGFTLNGFQVANKVGEFGGENEIHFLSILLSSISAIFVVINIIFLILKKDNVKFQIATASCVSVFSIFYLICGFMLKSRRIYKYPEAITKSYIPFILVMIILTAMIVFWILAKKENVVRSVKTDKKYQKINVPTYCVEEVKELIAKRVEEENAKNASTNQKADELLVFKNLLDNGAITEEEFNQKKKQILGL